MVGVTHEGEGVGEVADDDLDEEEPRSEGEHRQKSACLTVVAPHLLVMLSVTQEGAFYFLCVTFSMCHRRSKKNVNECLSRNIIPRF